MTAIYSFHMPAFVFLAGITAKSNKLLDRVLVFLVLVVTAQPVYRYWVAYFDEPPDADVYEPYWITWFLLAMDEGHGFAKKSNRDFQREAETLFLQDVLELDGAE